MPASSSLLMLILQLFFFVSEGDFWTQRSRHVRSSLSFSARLIAHCTAYTHCAEVAKTAVELTKVFLQKIAKRAHSHIASKMPSSKLYQRFIEASTNFSWSCTKFSLKLRWNVDDSHFNLILFFEKLRNVFIATKNSTKLRWNVDEASMTAFSMLCVNGPLTHL